MPFLIALGIGLALTPLLARVGRAAGLVDHPSGSALKIHAEPRPLTGGIAIVFATLIAQAIGRGEVESWTAGIVVLLVLGVVDDLVSLPAVVRLLGEVAAGVALALAGLTLSPLGDAGPVVLALAVLALANAVNFVDGQDGLAGGLATASALGVTAILASQGSVGDLGPALVASLLAFLVWNRPPASVFLGDGGAYAVAGLLVVLASSAATTWEALLGVLVCMTPFVVELVSTIVRRLVTRSAMTSGDRSHLYDLLAIRLGGRERSTGVIVGVGICVSALGLLVAEIPLLGGVAITLAIAIASAVGVRVLWTTTSKPVRRSQ